MSKKGGGRGVSIAVLLWQCIMGLFWLVLVIGHSQAFVSHIYDGGHDELKVGQVRFNDTIMFPADLRIQVRRRYILTGVGRGMRYLLHLSYLGSPAVKYTMHVRRLHRSLLEHESELGTGPSPGQRRLADVVMLHMETGADRLHFAYIDGDGDVDNGGGSVDEADGDYVPVLELHGMRDAFPVQPERWRVFFYNLRLEAIGSGKGINRLLLWHSVFVTISVVAALLLVPTLIAAIAGDAPRHLQPRCDLLICLIDCHGAAKKRGN